MPTVVSEIVSCSQMARAMAARSSSERSSCSCSSSKSCISGRRSDRLGSLNDAGQGFRRQAQDRRLVEGVAHLRCHAGLRHGLQPFAMNARVLVLILDLTSALLHRYRPAALGAFAAERNERIAAAAETAGEIPRRLGTRVEMLMEHPEGRRVHESVLP